MSLYKLIKIGLTIIGVALVLFGFSGNGSVDVVSLNVETGRFYDPIPLRSVDGIAVDSAGNIYYGSFDYSSIQVYDSEGLFLYRFSFQTGGRGYFWFHI
ncbi:MAG: hypothetical protein FWE68_06055, partial [Defluviitaleaceae bacterium]|nr:hypothetical protein [Defluviitaleaceae bacterium]